MKKFFRQNFSLLSLTTKNFTGLGFGKGKNFVRDRKEVLDTLVQTAKELHSQYGSPNRIHASKAGNKMEFFAKAIRKMYLLEGCFHSQKHIIPVKRLRNPNDTMISLRKNNELACVIEAREEFKEFNFVVDLNLVKKFHQYLSLFTIKKSELQG